MLHKIMAPKSFFAGLIYMLAGSGFFLWSQSYRIGTATRMGPGYFPALLGIVLFCIGVGAVFVGLRSRKPDPIEKISIEPLVLISLAVISFGLLIKPLGLIPATAVCLFFACFRRLLVKPLEVLALFVGISAFNYLVFIYAFGLPIRPFWWS